METKAITKPVSEMSVSELKAFLREKEAQEKRIENQRKEAYQKDKEEFLNGILPVYEEFQQGLIELKKGVIGHAENFNKLKYEIESKEPKDYKSFELKNEHVKVVVETQERFDFTDEAIVHINAIKDIFKAKFEARNKGFYNLLDGILMKNTKGDYDVKLLTKAQRQVRELGDEVLTSEFGKLSECLIVTGSAKYVRVYKRDEHNKWKDISLNFSSL
ncbi:MAG: DUF3164 family protein [Flavobacteriaceae bacterium]|nr:DUF3164 family protein [Flavobacteriaceae bacterium]MDZ4147847.1 DUF3164 family protein [Flavobacteriaceae bacterium]